LVDKIEVGRGRILELADRIQVTKSKGIWENKLFSDKDAWQKLKASAYEKWADLVPADRRKSPNIEERINPRIEELDSHPEGRLQRIADVLYKELAPTEAAQSEASIEAWIKQRAWETMLDRAVQQWPELKEFKAEMDRVPPDSTEELVSFIQAKGVV